MNKIGLIFFGLLFLAGCSAHKKITQTHAAEANNLKQLTEALEKKVPEFSWLRSKGTIRFESPSQKFTANTNLKMRDDSLIWMSANLFIEVARGMATQDSAVILNRTAKEYSVFPVSGLESFIGIPDLNIKAFQKILLAHPPFDINPNSKFEIKENSYIIQNNQPNFVEEIEINTSNLQLVRYHYERNNSEKVTITYNDFVQVEAMQLPKKIEFSIETPQKILLSLNISEYNLLPTDEAPFNIPASYKKVQ